MQKQIQALESQRNKMLQKEKIMQDEKASQLLRIKQLEAKNDQLNENLEQVQRQMGVPKAQYDQLKAQMGRMHEEIVQL